MNSCFRLSLIIFTCVTTVLSSCSTEGTKNIEQTEALHSDSVKRPQSSTKSVFPQIHGHLNGRVSEFIFEIHQDRHNNWWFCTNHDGIVSYDGGQLRTYTKENGLGGDAVRCMLEDKAGRLWFGTSGGLTIYDGHKFKNHVLGSDPADNEIWSLAMDENGTIWIATNNGLFIWSDTGLVAPHLPLPTEIPSKPMLSPKRVAQVLIDTKGYKWVVTDGFGIIRMQGEKTEWLNTNTGWATNNMSTVFEDRSGKMWIGSFNAGLSIFDGKNIRRFQSDNNLLTAEISQFCEDQLGNVWFSAEQKGVYRFDGHQFKQFTTADGLASNTVQHIYCDQKGQVWFCTWQGISLWDGQGISDVAEKEPWAK